MRTETIEIYTFNELPEEAKERAIRDAWEIKVDCDWWHWVYEDAERIGLKIKSFDDYKLNAVFIDGAEQTAWAILDEHGQSCDTYKLAQEYLADRVALVAKHSDGIRLDVVSEDNEMAFDCACDELDEDFLYVLKKQYRVMLINEYEWLTSDEQVAESLIANEYEFLSSGEMY